MAKVLSPRTKRMGTKVDYGQFYASFLSSPQKKIKRMDAAVPPTLDKEMHSDLVPGIKSRVLGSRDPYLMTGEEVAMDYELPAEREGVESMEIEEDREAAASRIGDKPISQLPSILWSGFF